LFAAGKWIEKDAAPVTSETSRRTISDAVTHVRDGDTIEVGGIPIRFSNLDCAERDTNAGKRATARMNSLTSNKILVCRLNGRKSYDRNIGDCTLPDGRDLSAVMVAERYCKRYSSR
jgi:endonuclease YncB( thermonuclease family)